jgi:hypothetical protein
VNMVKPSQAFIAAPPLIDTTVIRDELSRRGIHPYQLDEVARAGQSLTEVLEESIRQADLVVAVVGNGDSEGVLLELGYALGSKKRTLVIVPPGEEPPMKSVPYLRTRPDNREAIDFGLTQLLAAPPPRQAGTGDLPPGTKPLGPVADDLLRRLEALGAYPDEQDLGELVHDALTAGGISVMYRSIPHVSAAEERADFAVWSDDFEPWIGNPLLIEVRTEVEGEGELDRALGSLAALLEKRGSTWGLLLYHVPDFGSKVKAMRCHPRTFVMTIQRFLTGLRDASLTELLKGMRDQRVRGRG